MRPETHDGLQDEDNEFGFDLSDEEPTKPGNESMKQIMDSMYGEDETVRSSGIPTSTSERPTHPIRPIIRWREGD